MAYATDADLLLRVPVTAGVDADLRAAVLLDARRLINDSNRSYDTRTVPAHCYLTAHILTIVDPGTMGGEAGQVTSLKAGEIAASFAAPSYTTDETLATTKWGRLYMMIRKTVISTAGVYG